MGANRAENDWKIGRNFSKSLSFVVERIEAQKFLFFGGEFYFKIQSFFSQHRLSCSSWRLAWIHRTSNSKSLSITSVPCDLFIGWRLILILSVQHCMLLTLDLTVYHKIYSRWNCVLFCSFSLSFLWSKPIKINVSKSIFWWKIVFQFWFWFF